MFDIWYNQLTNWGDKIMKLKNLNVRGKLLLLLTTGVLSYTLVSCISSNKVPEIDANLENTLENTKDDTLLDEVLDVKQQNGINYKDFLELEEQVNKYNLVKDVKLEESYKDLSEAAKEQIDDMSLEEIQVLINNTKGNLSSVETARVEQKIYYIKTNAEQFITENGKDITIEMLKRAVKAGICDAVGLEPSSYNQVTINPASVSNPFDITTVVKDSISGTTMYKHIDSDSIYGKMTKYIYYLQGEDEISLKDLVEAAEDAMNYIKISAYSGAEENNNTVTSEYNYTEVEDKVKTK